MLLQQRESTQIIKEFKGGSGAKVLLLSLGQQKVVRKWAVGEARQKLEYQYQWYQTSRNFLSCPTVLGVQKNQSQFSFDMEYLEDHRNLFELFREDSHQAIDRFEEAIYALVERFYDPLERTSLLERRDYYIQCKLIDKVVMVAKRLRAFKSLFEAECIEINSRPYLNVLPALEILLKNTKLMSDFASVRPTRLHGDLTLENILVARDRVYFIDPNNENHLPTEMVDWAKLYQSVDSKYELAAHVKDVKLGRSSINYSLPEAEFYGELKKKLRFFLAARFDQQERKLVHFHQAIHLARLLPYQLKSGGFRFWPMYGELVRKLNMLVDGVED